MGIRERLSGNEAIAIALKQINPDVMGAFPITPSTEIPQYFSQYVANGEVDTEFIAVESEHSAMSTCIGASAAGARAGHVNLYRGFCSRSKSSNGNILGRAGTYVGAFVGCGISQASDNTCMCQQGSDRSDKY